MSPNPAGKKWVTAQSKTSFVSGGSVRNAVCVSSQCDPTIFVICMRFNLSGDKSIRRGSRFARRSTETRSLPARLICCPHRLDRPSRSRPRLDCISAASRSARPLQHSSQVVVPTHRPCRSSHSLHCGLRTFGNSANDRLFYEAIFCPLPDDFDGRELCPRQFG